MSFACGFEACLAASVHVADDRHHCPFQESGAAESERGDIEDFIRAVYARRFDASVHGFMPELVARRDALGRIVAAAGIRIATEPLFLEQYLDRPVERHIERLTGLRPDRAAIAEVGQLAAARAGEGRKLIFELARRLAGHRVEWVVGTLTEELRHLFARMGVEPLVLDRADPQRLAASHDDWGRYYEHRPQVLAGHLPTAIAQLRRVEARNSL
jgi:hypothetical protein